MKLMFRKPYPYILALGLALLETALCLGVLAMLLWAAGALAHTPPLEQLPDTMLAQTPGPLPTDPSQSPGSLVLNAFLQYVLPPLVVLIASLLAFALKKLSDFLHVKAQGSAVGQALVTGSDFVTTAVSHVISQLAPDVRDALANDGKIDDAERAALKAKALALIKAELPDGIKAVLGGVMQGGLETWLSGKAEQAIAAASGVSVPSMMAASPSPQ
jgi:hypothetical protein